MAEESTRLTSGRYLASTASNALMPASPSHWGSPASLAYAAEITPCEFSSPAGRITVAVDALTLEMMVTGFQFISPSFLIACAPNFGVVKNTTTSGLDDLIRTTCESMVGSDTS